MRGRWSLVRVSSELSLNGMKPSALTMRCPALLILTTPVLHCLRIVLDFSGLRVKAQFAVHLPGNVGKLQHRDRNIADGNWSVEFLPLANAGNEIGKVQVG